MAEQNSARLNQVMFEQCIQTKNAKKKVKCNQTRFLPILKHFCNTSNEDEEYNDWLIDWCKIESNF